MVWHGLVRRSRPKTDFGRVGSQARGGGLSFDTQLRSGKERPKNFSHFLGDTSTDLTVLQLALRAVVVFCFAVGLFRLLPRKSLANTSVIDVVLTVLIGSSLSSTLTGNAPLWPVMVGCLTLGALRIAMGWLAIHNDLISRIVKGCPLLVIRDGNIDEAALRRAQMGRRDLEQELRGQGYARVQDVPRAYIERNGSVSVVSED